LSTIAKEGHGKRAGDRAITYYGGKDIPTFLLTVFAPGATQAQTRWRGACVAHRHR
jgi:hypothetical protein